MEQTIQLAVNALQETLRTAGLIVQNIWLVLVKHSLVVGIQKLVISFFSFIASGMFLRMAQDTKNNKDIPEVDKRYLFIFFLFAMLSTLFIGGYYLVESLPFLLNPQYFAAQEAGKLIQMVK